MKKIAPLVKKTINGILKDKDNKRLAFNVAGNYIVKGLSMIVSFLVMPAYMEYFTSQKLLGMWFTVVSIIEWVLHFDFGIGAGMRNQILTPLVKGDRLDVKRIVSASYLSVAALVILLIFIQHFFINYINWFSILGLGYSDISKKTLILILHILFIGVCFRFFSILTMHLLYALQYASIVSLLNFLSSVFILIYLKIVPPGNAEVDIIKLALIQALATNVPALIAMVIIFAKRLKGMAPSIEFFQLKQAKIVLGKSGWLFYLQLLIMIVFGVKEFLISWFVGAEQVVEYQVYHKLIGIVGTLFVLALSPIWSAVTQAFVQKRISWIKELYKKGVQIIIAFSIGQIVIVLLMPWINHVWLGKNAIVVHFEYCIIFCIFNSIYMWVMMNYQFACGLERPKVLSASLSIAFFLNILLSLFLCQIFPIWIMIIFSITISLLPCSILVPKDVFSYLNKK